MKAFSITDVGMKRTVNQDYIFCDENAIGIFHNLFIVADGMGGHNAGDYASKFGVHTFVESIKTSQIKTPVGVLEKAIDEANSALFDKAASDSSLEGMGTTFVAATIFDHTMYVANIGDSRLYVIGDEIKQITEDHSLVEAMVKTGEIERKDARVHPNKNIITRALGTNKSVTADFFEVKLNENDIILMCSDGLSNMLDDEEIKDIIVKNKSDLETAGNMLVDRANENGGKDNIAIIIVQQ
jgi:Serine/threonine protein phosphatase